MNLSVERADILVVEREEAAEEGVEQHAHRPNVGLGAQVVLPGHELGGGVGGGAAAGLEDGGGDAALGVGAEAEVDQLELVVGVDQDVF